MIPSIRTFLLINLLLSVTLITSLAIVGNLLLGHKDIQNRLDAQLIGASLQMKAFFSDYHNKPNFNTIQKHLNLDLKKETKKISPNTNVQVAKEQQSTTEFQIWNQKGKLVLHSKNAPAIPLSSGRTGLSVLQIDGRSFHVSTLYDSRTNLTFMLAEQSNYRRKLENQLTKDSIVIMLFTYPFLGFLVWSIVGRGLNTLKKVAREVRHRAPSNLKPVSLESVPTEIRPLVIELNGLFLRLQEAFEREKRFTADAAHELKTPLAALSTQTQVALRASTTKIRNQALLKLLAGVNRSTHMVQQLLTLSRMVPEATLNDLVLVNIAEQTADVAALLAPEAIAKNIDLELISSYQKVKTILGHPTAINILIRNLVDNAIRYTPENGKVKIILESKDKNIVLRVIDNGPGIPDKLRKRVFERFFRIVGNEATGSGLGLGIVQQIAKLHHATIELSTGEDNTGLEVKVTFPENFQKTQY